MLCVNASAPAKAILIGEHFVVWGSKALVTGLSLRAYVRAYKRECPSPAVLVSSSIEGKGRLWPKCTLGRVCYLSRIVERLVEEYGALHECVAVEISSAIPPSAGLGSSASVAAAFAAALLVLRSGNIDLNFVNELAYEAEKEAHGKPSGIDNTVAVFGGTLIYQRDTGVVERVKTPALRKVKLVLIHTGVERRTREAVERALRVRSLLGETLERKVVKLVDALVDTAVEALKNGDFQRLGAIMRFNHGLLNGIAVSNPLIEDIVHKVEGIEGVYGVKVTGAGLGGIILALTTTTQLTSVVSKLSKLNLKTYVASVDEKGVRVQPCTQHGQ